MKPGDEHPGELRDGPTYRQLIDCAVAGARAGGEVLTRYFRSADLEIEAKGHHDFVTRADHESEARILEEIQRRFPDHSVLAEESGFQPGSGEQFSWLVDPLDGTSNYLQGLPVFCVSIGCRLGDQMVVGAVFDPLGDNLFISWRGGGSFWNGRPMRVSPRGGLDGAFLATGYPFKAQQALDLYLAVFRSVFLRARGIRRCGSAALDLAYTAAGVYDGFFEFRLSPWDFAAGSLLLHEAGGRVTDLDGGENFFTSGNLIAGPSAIHSELLALVQETADEAALDAVHPL